MSITGTYDSTIYCNPANKYCVVRIKTSDQSVPKGARARRKYADHLIRFVAVGYDLPCTDAVELSFDGEWVDGKYGQTLPEIISVPVWSRVSEKRQQRRSWHGSG